jgi:hypothetical protein
MNRYAYADQRDCAGDANVNNIAVALPPDAAV